MATPMVTTTPIAPSESRTLRGNTFEELPSAIFSGVSVVKSFSMAFWLGLKKRFVSPLGPWRKSALSKPTPRIERCNRQAAWVHESTNHNRFSTQILRLYVVPLLEERAHLLRVQVSQSTQLEDLIQSLLPFL